MRMVSFTVLMVSLGAFFWNANASIINKSKTNPKYRVVVVKHEFAFGEAQAVENIARAAANIGWECKVVLHRDFCPKKIKAVDPDFVISLREEIVPIEGYIHFLYLHVPMFMYLNKDGTLCTRAYPNILKYQGFLSVVPDVSPVKVAYTKTTGKPFFSTQTVFSVPNRAFNDSPKTRLCYSGGCLWDKTRAGQQYQKVYRLLDQTNYFDLFGMSKVWGKMNLKSYRGFLPVDDHTVVDTIENCGISLVLHSHEHIKGGVPTSRIFEAAAASAVIICDHHPFVEREFGDSVLYINPNQEPEKVFAQIDTHVKWVHKNPDKAIELARRSHAIFVERFTLENELLKISKLYESMLKP
ncbi:MAG: glycosyltransferase [Alphaproteobacteria bacterium]|nr:glycosyltransferase [Alphaproteobacteria bacterium]